MFQKIDETVKETGSIVSAEGKPFTAELFLEVLEKMFIRFDDEGNLVYPVITIPPSQLSQVKRELERFDNDPDLKRKRNELIERKRSQFNEKDEGR